METTVNTILNNNYARLLYAVLVVVFLFLIMIGTFTEGMSGRWGYHDLAAPYGAARPASHNSHRADTGFPVGQWYQGVAGAPGPLNVIDHGVEGFLGNNYPGPIFSQNPYMMPYSAKAMGAALTSLVGTGGDGSGDSGGTNDLAVDTSGNIAENTAGQGTGVGGSMGGGMGTGVGVGGGQSLTNGTEGLGPMVPNADASYTDGHNSHSEDALSIKILTGN